MVQDAQNLIWIDLEMTGLEPQTDRIIEVATVVTDKHLNIVAKGPVIAVHQEDDVLARMDEWNRNTHGASGLIERVRASPVGEAEAESLTLEFLQQWVPADTSPMCGNTVYQDRRFLHRYMRKLENYFHYRLIDVSTLKELAERWVPEVNKGFTKKNSHRALDDIIESIDELKHYRDHFLKL